MEPWWNSPRTTPEPAETPKLSAVGEKIPFVWGPPKKEKHTHIGHIKWELASQATCEDAGSGFMLFVHLRHVSFGVLFPDEYNSILIRSDINVPEIPKMNPDNR